jgi:hypothetical protein
MYVPTAQHKKERSTNQASRVETFLWVHRNLIVHEFEPGVGAGKIVANTLSSEEM